MVDKIETHGSERANARVDADLIEMTNLLKIAGNTLHYNVVKSYLVSLDAFYINNRGLFEKEDINKCGRLFIRCNQLCSIVDTDSKARTKKAMIDLLHSCKKIHIIMTDSLHKKDYFFRMRKDNGVHYE